MYVCMYVCMYVYIYIYVCMCVYIYIYIYSSKGSGILQKLSGHCRIQGVAASDMSYSSSHRRGTLKGVPTVKSPTNNF